MYKLLKENGRLNETLFLGVLTLLCFSFSIFRIVVSDTRSFLFLNWNLFLAIIPWVFTSLVILKPKLKKNKFSIVVLLFSWLLFFPNAPYILTDLFHLRTRLSMPIWFDLILILSFAWTGLLFGLLSLRDIELLLREKIKYRWSSMIVIALLFIGSFGIYLGRFLRWNSWDILSEPTGIIYDIGERIINPFDHPRTWGMTLFMGLFLNMIYWSFNIRRKKSK